MSLTKRLKEFDFMCVEENQLYLLNIGFCTTLFVEATGSHKGHITYIFYKQTFGRFSTIQYYGKELREKQVIARVEKYFINRHKQMLKQLRNQKRGYEVKSRKELLNKLLAPQSV